MPSVKLPNAEQGGSIEETVNNALIAINKQKRNLEWLLANLDEANILQMVSENSDKILFSRGGLVQSWGDSIIDNVDATNKLRMDFYVPDTVSRIDVFKLFFRLLPFTAYSTGASSSGGSTQTSGASSSSTSDGYTQATWSTLTTYSAGAHDHDGEVTSEAAHEHSYEIIGGHKHGISHTHSVTVPNHTHGITYGIYKSTSPTGVKVYVDGTLRLDNGGSGYATDQGNLDISEWVTTSGWHYVELSSTQLGRISAAYFTQVFITA